MAFGADRTIDGSRIGSIDDLYDQLNDLLMADEDWRMAPSLDALNDVLYGVRSQDGPVRFTWLDHERSRRVLGVEATIGWLQGKLAQPGRFDVTGISARVRALERGEGSTYFDLVLEVFAAHADRIDLVLR